MEIINKKSLHFYDTIDTKFCPIIFFLLCLFLTFNIFCGPAVAAPVIWNFDGYSNGTVMNTVGDWSLSNGRCVISNTENWSYPNSLFSPTPGAYISPCILHAVSSDTFNFHFYLPQTTDQLIAFFLVATSSPSYWWLQIDYLDVVLSYCYNSDCANASVQHTSGSLAGDFAHDLNINFANNIGSFKLDTYATNTVAATTTPINYFEFYNPITYSNGTYIDNLTVNNTNIPSNIDNVIWVNPNQPSENTFNTYTLFAQPGDAKYFNWSVNWTFSSSTAATYANDNPYIVIQYVNASSSVVNEIDLTDNLQFYDYTEGNIFNMNTRANWFLPSETGIYTAMATLRASSIVLPPGGVILASSTVQFIIATSSPPITPNNAWCSGLCYDINTSQSTTTAVWGIPIPWINWHPLNDGFCLIIYAGCYLWTPRTSDISAFFANAASIQNDFPFNTFFTLANTIDNVFSSSTMASTTFNMIWIKQGTSTMQYVFIPILSSTSVPNLIGSDNNIIYRRTIGYLMDAAVAGAIIFLIF